MTAWTFNRDYKDLGQVEQFYPAYLARYEQLVAAGKYPYNDEFKGCLPGAEGPSEDAAIYLCQTLRSVREMEAQVAALRAAGWRDLEPGELDKGPVRFAGVAQYGWYMGGTGLKVWGSARIAQRETYQVVLPGRSRTNGHIVAGKLLVQPEGAR